MEERFGRLRWLAADDAVAPSASEAAGAADADAGPRVPPPEGNAALGCRVSVWWIDDAQYYRGTVKEFDPETGVCPRCAFQPPGHLAEMSLAIRKAVALVPFAPCCSGCLGDELEEGARRLQQMTGLQRISVLT